MKHVMIALAIALAAGTANARADTGSDAAFVQTAQADLLGQYALAVLAQSHASAPGVKSLASAVAANASAGNRFLASYAKAHGIKLTGQPTIRADSQYGEMSAVHGAPFDQRFTQDIYTDLEMQQSDFQTAVTDPVLARFASHESSALGTLGNQAEKLGG
jgi:predicted outer membrane protein